MEKARQKKLDTEAIAIRIRNKKIVGEYRELEPSWDGSPTKLMEYIGGRHDLKRTAAVDVIKRELKARGLKPAKPRKA